MLKKALLSILLWSISFADVPTLDTIETFPTSRAKDFYIWSFLQNKSLSAATADTLFSQFSTVNTKLFTTYAKRSNNPFHKEAVRCMKLSSTQFLTETIPCVTLGLSPYKATKLTHKNSALLYKRLKNNPNFQWLKLMLHVNQSKQLEKDPKNFLTLFNRSGKQYRQRLNHTYTKAFLQKLSQEKQFDRFVQITALDKHLSRIQKSLLYFKPTHPISADARFYLGLNALEHFHFKTARKHLKIAAKTDFFQMNRDKALFWLYQIDHDKRILNTLYTSTDLNIYTLFAAQTLKKEPLGYYVPNAKESNNSTLNEADPFAWNTFVSMHKDNNLSKTCETLNTINAYTNKSTYAFYLEKCSNYALHPFVTPYLKELSQLSTTDKALFYALGRQESRLIAGGLSSVFAQGMMQLMPFLSKAIAKQKKETIQPSTMFNPKKNIEFARYYLRFLQHRFSSVLYIAYAYNGGIGFMKSLLKHGFFKNTSRFEPYLSMEKIPYPETREYGKKVLSNYVIYTKILGKPISLFSLVHTLK